MKNTIITLLFLFIFTKAFTQDHSAYRIFGEITTVENITYRGYITWNDNKNYWIDFLEASKTENPYATYFRKETGILFKSNGQAFYLPPVHSFSCRFGNIKSIRITGENQIRLRLKNEEEITLEKGHAADINTHIKITTATENLRLPWEQISEIRFMQADSLFPAPKDLQIAGSVKSTQGIYKGLVYWNYQKELRAEKRNNLQLFLNRAGKITKNQENKRTELRVYEGSEEQVFYVNPELLTPMHNVMVNMPNIGYAVVSWGQFNELEVLPCSELNLLSYCDFPEPQVLQGEVWTHSGQVFRGKLIYDLDESYDFELLDGKNNFIEYHLPFRYIRSIEPKNYQFSFITLRNGSQISLGGSCDVNQENNGILILNNGQNPVYIPWSEIKKITLQ